MSVVQQDNKLVYKGIAYKVRLFLPHLSAAQESGMIGLGSGCYERLGSVRSETII